MIGEAEEAGPENFLDGGFPGAPVVGRQRRRFRAKEKNGFRKLRGDAGDPERGVEVARETEDGVEISAVNDVPETGIEKPEKGFCAGAAVGDVAPCVTVKEGNVPLNVGAKFGIVGGFGAAKSATGDLEIEGRVGAMRQKIGAMYCTGWVAMARTR